MGNEWYIAPKALDFKTIRSHEDLKLILPLTEVLLLLFSFVKAIQMLFLTE
jgi:hypothetical protein